MSKDNNTYYDPSEQNATMDLSGVEAKLGFDALPAGTYAVEVDDSEYKLSSNDNPMLVLKLKVIDHEDKKINGRFLWENLVLNNDFGVKKLKVILSRWFPDVNVKTFNPETFADSGDAIGAKGMIKLTVKKQDGETRNNIRDFAVYNADAAGMQVAW